MKPSDQDSHCVPLRLKIYKYSTGMLQVNKIKIVCVCVWGGGGGGGGGIKYSA